MNRPIKNKRSTNKNKNKNKKMQGKLTLKNFKGNSKCYDRKTQNNLAVVDTHLHIRPFGGNPIPLNKLLSMLHKSNTLFVQGEGIGQRLKNKTCDYYKNCQHSKVYPSIINDLYNASNLSKHKNTQINIKLSMTFSDLNNPENILENIQLLNTLYPNTFNWMGEVNVVKQTLFIHGQYPVPVNVIAHWRAFMAELYKRKYPLSLHCDLGNNADNFKYLPLMQEVLRLYPNNVIVWMHLGLCQELTNISAYAHTQLIDSLLQQYKHLYFDLSWRILYDQMFNDIHKKQYYIDLINKWPSRFLPGSDYVGSIKNKNYGTELTITSKILKDVNDVAFRRIALGQNYFDITHSKYLAPPICK